MGILSKKKFIFMFFIAPKIEKISNLRKSTSIIFRNTRTINLVSGCLGSLDNYAVIDVGGTQKIVKEGRYYSCNRLQTGRGSIIRFGRVLAIKNDGKFHIGAPWMKDALIEAEILEEIQGDKILVYKMNPKKHTRKLNGHRQKITRFLVTKINMPLE